jgi:hypothetical protein
MTLPVGIYQPLYKPRLAEFLDDGFLPLDWLHNPMPGLRESALHLRIASERLYRRHRLTGLLSPKFFSKTGLASSQVHAWIEDNPGYDLYLINGASYYPYVNYNAIERTVEQQGPGCEQKIRVFANAIDFRLPAEFPRQRNPGMCRCNYWIASQGFWDAWIEDIVVPSVRTLTGHQSAKEFLAPAHYSAPTPHSFFLSVYENLIDLYVKKK